MKKNREIADIFEKMADILDLLEENPFRIRAYRNAARSISDLGRDIEDIAKEDGLSKIPGVGNDLSGKIREYLELGEIKDYQKLRSKVPDGLVELLSIQGLGPKTLSRLHKELDVKNLSDLQAVLQGEEILKLRGMGEKKVQDIKRGIRILEESAQRMLLGIALPLAEEIIHEIAKIPGTEGTIAAGSLRRMKETIGDIDILTMADHGEKVVKAFTQLPLVKNVLASGDTKGSIFTKDGIQVDLRVVEPESYGAALQYFTGSKAHNVKLRTLALRKGFKINEYGIFRGDKKVAGETEEEIYKALEIPLIPPEMREDNGEIEAALRRALPGLVEIGDIRGDLHMHSKWSDGKASIEEMALKAKELGYQYIAMTDHSPSSRIAKGLSVESLYQKKNEVEELNKKLSGIKILMGAEVDVRSDGSLDYPDDILKDLDVVVISVHSGFKMDRETMTRRIVKALKNPLVHILGHPTGRLVGERDPYPVDIDEVIKTVQAEGKAIEVNSSYFRLDLNDANARKAADSGVKTVISTDSHRPEQLAHMRYGVGTARRGWVEKENVLNTVPPEQLMNWLTRVRAQRN